MTPTEEKEFYATVRELDMREGKVNFYHFSKCVNGHSFFDAGRSLMDWHHEELCGQLQGMWESRFSRIKTQHYIEWCRGTLKSTVASEDFPMWCALNDPNIRVLIDSQLLKNAQSFLGAIKSKFEDAFFKFLYGQMYNSRQGWSDEELYLKRTAGFKEPTFTASGLDASKVSKHFDLIVADDLIGDTNCNSPEQLEKAKSRFGGYGSLLNPHGMLIVAGTVWGPDDLGAHIDELQKKAEKRYLPKPFTISRYRDYKNGKKIEGPEFPTLLPEEKLAQELLSQGERLYSCNYALERRNDKTATFQFDKVRYHDKRVSDFKDYNIYITVDPRKEGEGDNSDFATIAVALVDPQFNIYLIELVRERYTDLQLFDRVFELNDRYRPMAVGFEAVFEQNTAFNTLKTKAEQEGKILPIRKLKTSFRVKDLRIRGLAPVIESGRLYIKDDMYDLKWELFYYKGPKSLKHDDCLDVVAYLLEFIETPLVNPEKKFYDDPAWAKNWDEELQGKKPDPNDVQWMRAERNSERRKVRRRFPALSRW